MPAPTKKAEPAKETTDDLDALLADITSAEPADAPEGFDDALLDDILAPDHAVENGESGEEVEDGESGESEIDDSTLSAVIDSALSIEDVAEDATAEKGATAEDAELAELAAAATAASAEEIPAEEAAGEDVPVASSPEEDLLAEDAAEEAAGEEAPVASSPEEDLLAEDVAEEAGASEDVPVAGSPEEDLLAEENEPASEIAAAVGEDDQSLPDANEDAISEEAMDEDGVTEFNEIDAAAELPDEDVTATLRELGLSVDGELLHNRFSSEKEKLLKHLLDRFEQIARRKLSDLPNEQVRLIRSVNLRVDIELKFGEFTASGDDDSVFQLDF
ncbi:hypothetical protein FACS1894139_13590 [Planctomycetales bacterium]|nr:hypothetical protein FACS1894107_07020 [Planctomycetales bacterium]GHT06827.1 hypothetical protein FACS1894139_13590 [Planctomycetales bacterium]